MDDQEYSALAQSFLEKHIFNDSQRQKQFFVYANHCMQMMWAVHPKNPVYATVTDFKKLKEVRRAVKSLICEVRELCKQSL